MNQLLMAGIGAAVIAAGAFTAGWRVNSWRHDSQQLAIEQAAAKAGEAATTAAVDAIGKIKHERVTIRQELEREIHHAPAVGVECNITDGVRDALNRALAPPASGAPGVPGPDAAP